MKKPKECVSPRKAMAMGKKGSKPMPKPPKGGKKPY